METSSDTTDDVIEVEVERMPLEHEETAQRTRERRRRAVKHMSPIVAGLIVDALDAGTFGAFGVKFGLPLGVIAGYWLAGGFGIKNRSASGSPSRSASTACCR